MRSGDPAFSSTGRRLGEAHLRLMAAKRRGPTASGLAVLVLVMAVLVACAPVQQGAFRPTQLVTAGFSEGWFETFDGARLGLNVWRPDTAQGGAADGAETVIVAVHGMNDYAGAFNGAGGWWAKRGATVYAYDQRGFGRSPNSGIWPEHELMRQDLRTAVEVARRLHPDARIAVVGESMGASVAVTAFASEKPPRADALVLLGRASRALPGEPVGERPCAARLGRGSAKRRADYADRQSRQADRDVERSLCPENQPDRQRLWRRLDYGRGGSDDRTPAAGHTDAAAVWRAGRGHP